MEVLTSSERREPPLLREGRLRMKLRPAQRLRVAGPLLAGSARLRLASSAAEADAKMLQTSMLAVANLLRSRSRLSSAIDRHTPLLLEDISSSGPMSRNRTASRSSSGKARVCAAQGRLPGVPARPRPCREIEERMRQPLWLSRRATPPVPPRPCCRVS